MMTTYTAFAYETIDDAFGAQYHTNISDPFTNVNDALDEMHSMDCGEGCGIYMIHGATKVRLDWENDMLVMA